jgi:hypothetical protein
MKKPAPPRPKTKKKKPVPAAKAKAKPVVPEKKPTTLQRIGTLLRRVTGTAKKPGKTK